MSTVLDIPARPLHMFANENGRIVLWKPATRLMMSHWDGRVDEAVAKQCAAAMTRIMGSEPGWLSFGDCWDLEDYERGTRVTVADFTKKMRPQLDGMHTLVRSKMVAMGVAVINMAMGGFLTVYSSKAKFQSALEAEIAKRK
jgi:hypothetical protein